MKLLSFVFALILIGGGSARALELQETPGLLDDIANGRVPPVSERVPLVPSVVDMVAEGKTAGRHGGTLRTLMGAAKDTRIITVYGYARLVVFDPELNLVADLLEAVEIEDGRIFTLRLRPGHKWSDGEPFTADDVKFWYDNLALDPDVVAKTKAYNLVGGEPMEIVVVDPQTEVARFV